MLAADIHLATHAAVAGIDAAQTAQEAGRAYCRYAEQFGLSHAMCCVLPETDLSMPGNGIFFSNPTDFAERIFAYPCVVNDVAFREMRRTSRPVYWAEQGIRRGISDEQNVLDLAMKREGIVDGVVIPLFVGHGLLGMMLLGGEMYGRFNDGICFLRLLSVFFYDRLCAMRRDVLREEYGLSAREFECMKWVAAGKTDWETGQILSISPKTVNYHVENAKRKFGVSTRLQGVVAAILSGAVEP